MNYRPCWQNCFAPNDPARDRDVELGLINRLEDLISPLDETAVQIRALITRFEACYHQADREAEMIIRAIGSGQIPAESGERPPQRKAELQNAHDILSAWVQGRSAECKNLRVGPVPADDLLGRLGKPTDLKIWQVERIIEKLKQSLDPSYRYHVMVLETAEAGGRGAVRVEGYYKDQADFLDQTAAAVIHYTLDGQPSEMPLAMAIDLLRPCNWNFPVNLAVTVGAVGGNLHPKETFAPCSLNARLTPLRGRLKILDDTLRAFWKQERTSEPIDQDLYNSLGTLTPQKQWLAASLDKTIRLHLGL
jgi:hypothetical protein